MQCPDKSDELECKRIIIGPTYLKDLPPPPSETGEKPPILVKVRLYSILNIDEVASLVKLQVTLKNMTMLIRSELLISDVYQIEMEGLKTGIQQPSPIERTKHFKQ